MQVLLWMSAASLIEGGHRVQIEKTAQALRQLGIDASANFETEPPSGGDLVHGFGLSPSQTRACRSARRPLVLSTIYWNRAYATNGLYTRNEFVSRLKFVTGIALAAVRGRHYEKCARHTVVWQDIRASYEMADLLLPNSEAEATQIVADLGVTTPMRVVPNAVDETLFTPGESSQARVGVLYAGRFEPHKNQLALIRAMSGTGIPTTLVGHAHPHHPDYFERCRRAADRNVTILPGRPHDELAPLYRAAKVHCLPSWFETTGLVSLEAALCGCNVVTTSRGYARDYFGEMAWYCDPADPGSIRSAVEAAIAAPARTELRDHVLQNYTWRHTAAATLAAYRAVLGDHRLLTGNLIAASGNVSLNNAV